MESISDELYADRVRLVYTFTHHRFQLLNFFCNKVTEAFIREVYGGMDAFGIGDLSLKNIWLIVSDREAVHIISETCPEEMVDFCTSDECVRVDKRSRMRKSTRGGCLL